MAPSWLTPRKNPPATKMQQNTIAFEIDFFRMIMEKMTTKIIVIDLATC